MLGVDETICQKYSLPLYKSDSLPLDPILDLYSRSPLTAKCGLVVKWPVSRS